MKKFPFFFLLLFTASNLPAQGSWSQKSNFCDYRGNAACFTIGNKLYQLTGFASTFKKDLWEWDQATDSWTQKANLPGPARLCAVAFSIGTKGYVGTGDIDGGSTNDFWEWDQLTNLWTRKADVPGGARSQAVGFSVAGYGFIGTGGSDSLHSSLQDFWKFDPMTNSWFAMPDYPAGKVATATSFTIGNMSYVGMGSKGSYQWDDSFWKFDPATNSWSAISNFVGGGRCWAIAFSIGNKGYAGMGCDYNNCYSDLWEWNSVSDTWTRVADIPRGNTYWAISGSLNTKGYVGCSNQLFEFTPDSVTTDIADSFHELQSLVAYPNPSKGIIQIDIQAKEKSQGVLEITDNKGHVLYSDKITGSLHTVNSTLKNKSRGSYYLNYRSRDFIRCQKLVVN